MRATGNPLVSVKEIEHCWIAMSDGVRLSARLWLPESSKNTPMPAILEYIPYRKHDMVRIRDERNHVYFARCGYACVRVDMRGSGDSEGVMNDMYCSDELRDAIEVIEWIADQSWCDGTVGMMGTSWGGTASLQTASNRPDALKAIIAVCATSNRFEDDIHYMGGCVLTDTVEWGATLPVILASPPDPGNVGSDWNKVWMERLEQIEFPLQNWIRHQTRDEYWRSGSVNEIPNSIQCPVLLIGGWVDRYSNTVMNFLAQCHDQCWGIVGPWGHHYPNQACPVPGIGFQQEAVRWWDYWLKGQNNGIDLEPRLRVWMQEYVRPDNRIDKRPGRWVSELAWPSKNISPQTYWFEPGKLLTKRNSEQEKVAVPTALVGMTAGDTGYFGRTGGLPLDQKADDELSLVFDSEILEQPKEVMGAIRFVVKLESDQSVATLVARLNDVSPEGDVARISYAVRNLALNDNLDGPSRLTPDKPQTFVITFPNTAYRFNQGHRIRLSLSNSYWPLIWPSPQTTQITLHLAGTYLEIPERENSSEEQPVHFPEPLESVDNGRFVVKDSAPLERWATNDVKSGMLSIQWKQPFKCIYYPDIDWEFGFETHACHKVKRNDPGSASTRFDHKLCFHHGNWTVEVDGTAELTSTETTYRISGSVAVRENGELKFERHWHPEIPRYNGE